MVKKKICLQWGRSRFDPWVGKISWRREWQPTPVVLKTGEFQAQRSLFGYCPWGYTELDMIEQLTHPECTHEIFKLRNNFIFHKLCKYYCKWAFPGGLAVKNPPAKQETRVWSWVRKIPWRRKWQPTPVFLPGKFHGQRLTGYSPWGHKSQTQFSH